jgi:hypothetical protein
MFTTGGTTVESFANGDSAACGASMGNGNSWSSGNSAGRDYARDSQGIGMMMFPHLYQHAMNWG